MSFHTRSFLRLLGATLLLASATACDDKASLRCGRVEGTWPSDVRFDDCSDGRERSVSCVRATPADDWMCSCERGKDLGATFNWPTEGETTPARDGDRVRELAERHCGWELR